MNTARDHKQHRTNRKGKIILVSTLVMPVHCNIRTWSDFQCFCQSLQQAIRGYHEQ